jgi:hypothetical protein
VSRATGRKQRIDLADITERNKDPAYIAERKKEALKRAGGIVGLFKALRSKPHPFVTYLRDVRGHLSEFENEAVEFKELEDLIYQGGPRIGRPRGSISPKNLAIACACCLVRIGKSAWRQKHRRQRVPKAVTDLLIKRAIELMEDRISETRGEISANAVGVQSHLKPDSEVENFVAEYLDDAQREMMELARR